MALLFKNLIYFVFNFLCFLFFFFFLSFSFVSSFIFFFSFLSFFFLYFFIFCFLFFIVFLFLNFCLLSFLISFRSPTTSNHFRSRFCFLFRWSNISSSSSKLWSHWAVFNVFMIDLSIALVQSLADIGWFINTIYKFFILIFKFNTFIDFGSIFAVR